MENSNEECPNTQNIIIMGVNKEQRAAMFFNPRCGEWDCPVCGEINRDYWIRQAMRGSMLLLERGSMLRFYTLTGRGYFTPASSIYFFRQNWPKLRKRFSDLTNRWSDVTGTEWAYFLIPERHESGVLHAHFIGATFLDRNKWIKDTAHSCGFGYMAKCRPVESSAAAVGYVTKYLTKNAGAIPWPKGFRRVRHSQNWPISKDLPIPGWSWERVKESIAWQEKNAFLDMGWQVVDKTSTDTIQ